MRPALTGARRSLSGTTRTARRSPRSPLARLATALSRHTGTGLSISTTSIRTTTEIDSATLYVSELEPGACVLPTGEKTGYDFDGWYEAKKDIGTASHKLNALSIAKKWELYGRYTAKTDVSYTVKYLREGDNKVLAPEKVVTIQTFDT